MRPEPGEIVGIDPVDAEHRVLSVRSGSDAYMPRPCAECPWRRSNAGKFPAGAFAHSVVTATDASFHKFACHMAGAGNVCTCAGFLLSLTADDNVGARILRATTEVRVSGDGCELFPTYMEMAVANGMDAADPRLEACMPEARLRWAKDDEVDEWDLDDDDKDTPSH